MKPCCTGRDIARDRLREIVAVFGNCVVIAGHPQESIQRAIGDLSTCAGMTAQKAARAIQSAVHAACFTVEDPLEKMIKAMQKLHEPQAATFEQEEQCTRLPNKGHFRRQFGGVSKRLDRRFK